SCSSQLSKKAQNVLAHYLFELTMTWSITIIIVPIVAEIALMLLLPIGDKSDAKIIINPIDAKK
ncbi:MAG TPA: hypothetical protein P5080_01250, partial [Candidatus Paceibacterota bacterium]|nr:hypothetical protein [Candidatus Pacearchaeota archaeon]HRZ50599.1 hypothetical protein [Candidatus Paceibacterota bacterium]HSA36320.1 hypothetical protein [Candidatus Paceibacterota bacterium]